MKDTHLQQAIEILRSGGIVIFPTDTAFGIGCRIDRTDSVDRLFTLRQRPRTKPTPVLVHSQDMALAYLDSPSEIVRRLMTRYWPGALTIIARCQKHRIYSPIRGGGNTIGVRMPDHAAALSLIRGVGVPILGPSANFHGKATPFSENDLDPDLVRLIDYVVPGVCRLRQASTVVDTTTYPATIVRQGALTLEPEELR